MLHKHCIFIPLDGFENLKFFSQICEKNKPDPILRDKIAFLRKSQLKSFFDNFTVSSLGYILKSSLIFQNIKPTFFIQFLS